MANLIKIPFLTKFAQVGKCNQSTTFDNFVEVVNVIQFSYLTTFALGGKLFVYSSILMMVKLIKIPFLIKFAQDGKFDQSAKLNQVCSVWQT